MKQLFHQAALSSVPAAGLWGKFGIYKKARLTLIHPLLPRIQYSSHGAYSQSKLALVLFTYYLQEQLTASSCCVTVNAVDPGMVDTALYDNLWTLVQLLKRPVAKILFRVRMKLFIVSSWKLFLRYYYSFFMFSYL